MATASERREQPRVEQTNTPTTISALTAIRERAEDQVEAAESASCDAVDSVEKCWLEDSARDQSRLANDFRLVILRQVPETISDVALLLDAIFDLTDAINPEKPRLTRSEAAALAISVENCLAFVGDLSPELHRSEHFAYGHGLAKQRMARRSMAKVNAFEPLS